MADTPIFSGVIAPVVTPFGEDGAPDLDRFVEHCEWLLEDGCTALAPFGTTSEGNSLGLDERMEMLEELVDSEIDPKKLMPGTGSCSVSDAIVLTEHAVDLGCGGVLMLPPFYYKNPSEEGLFRFFAEVIEEVADDALDGIAGQGVGAYIGEADAMAVPDETGPQRETVADMDGVSRNKASRRGLSSRRMPRWAKKTPGGQIG